MEDHKKYKIEWFEEKSDDSLFPWTQCGFVLTEIKEKVNDKERSVFMSNLFGVGKK